MKDCYIIYNTRWGYCLQPHYFKSVSAAIRDAKKTKMAFRLFSTNGGKLLQKSWYV